jgi:hypothetical protein
MLSHDSVVITARETTTIFGWRYRLRIYSENNFKKFLNCYISSNFVSSDFQLELFYLRFFGNQKLAVLHK